MGYHYTKGFPLYYLTVSVVDGNGTVDPDGIVKIYEGQSENVITLTADPFEGYRVKKWTGTDDDSSTALTNIVTVTEDVNVTVEFEPKPVYELTVAVVDGNGLFSVDPDTALVTTFAGSYIEGTTVTLRAKPDPNHYVDGWYDVNGVLVSVAGTVEVVMDSDRSLMLDFREPGLIEVRGGGNALHDAIESARSGDTIVVHAGTYDGGINLGGREDVTLASVNPDDPAIVAKTIIDCQLLGRAFTFDHGEDANTVIYGFTINDGSVSEQPGGAIYVGPGTSPKLANLVISGCSVTDGDGGAIYVDSNSSPTIAYVSINNCSVTNGDGGAIYVASNSSPLFIGCTITDCFASGGFGGGAYCASGSLPVFTACTFAGNSATYDGGGIYYPDGSTSTLSQCEFSQNSATSGGGVYYGADCSATLDNCTFVGNTALEEGGGILYGLGSSIMIVDCNLASNSATYGGALYLDPNCSGEVNDTLLAYNSADKDGGAIYLTYSDVFSVVDCNISSNTALYGAGLYCSDSPKASIIGCEIKHNEAVGIEVWYEYFIPDPNFVSDPNDPNATAPLLPISPNDPNFNLNDPTLITLTHEDRSAIARGGGIYSYVGPTLIENCQISYNSATTSGGGMYLLY
ncbi:MAG: right-handed parallel beta-helix repeat-containing protein, partial [Planctomycetota bacterium]